MSKPADGKPAHGVSRRMFLKTVGAGAATGMAQAAPPVILGPGPVPLALTINGALQSVTVEPRVTLLRVLRNHLGLTGAKEVFERGA